MNQATTQAQFTEYVTGRQAWLRRVAYLLCQDWHRADDLVQTSLTKLFLNWRRIDETANPDAYARTVLVNTFLAEQRSPWWKRVVLHREAEGAAEVEQAAFERAGGGQAGPDLEGTADLRRALPLLPPRQRAVIVLRYYCELSIIEAADALGCSTGTVKSQTFRAIETLRRLMHVEAEDADAAAGLRSEEPDGGAAAAVPHGVPKGAERAERARSGRLGPPEPGTTSLGGLAAANTHLRGGIRDGL
ncbi:SigE family RNA polymerase sigma factor [Actinospica durhamensis]|uniref:SigE family RNA polymerase sigma factor n=1 Tax=Actinospica durhamensis TaxID=1508375 RepID=A0A941ENF0_9ACTN|nr:SigE family RNA polymerase sigma factor [Actinospica durhamensis]MBR7832239.1 SigE family RNA polymerase sigma factor [Actinospica durhamensis]